MQLQSADHKRVMAEFYTKFFGLCLNIIEYGLATALNSSSVV